MRWGFRKNINFAVLSRVGYTRSSYILYHAGKIFRINYENTEH